MIQRRTVAATMASDPRKVFVGTSPYPGDTGFTGLVLPWVGAGTTSWQNRILCRLCCVAVPEGMVGRVISIGQLLTLAACVPAVAEVRQGPVLLKDKHVRLQDGNDPCASPAMLFERPVVTPLWTFPDGNVSWHLKAFRPFRKQSDKVPNPGFANYDNDMSGVDASVLTETFPPAAYVAANHGVPPGDNISGFGMWHDIRYDWRGTPIEDIAQPEIRGPRIIGMFATVYQTDPSTRMQPAVGAGIEQLTVDAGLVPEDKFMLAFPDSARYYRIGGRLVVDIRCAEHEVCAAPVESRKGRERKHYTPSTTMPVKASSKKNVAGKAGTR